MKTHAVNLLIKDKTCLIVGGGKVATRKFKSLVEKEAILTVVAPSISDKIKEYNDLKAVKLYERSFLESDLEGAFLVYISTDDKAFNAKLLNICKEKKIMACCVDENWKNSDFITPATLQMEDLTVSISSNGAQCRRTRTVREIIAKQLSFIDTVELFVLGTDHNFLSLEERESLHLTAERIEKVAKRISFLNGIQEFMLLNTCNRIELIAIGRRDPDLEEMIQSAMGFQNLEEGQIYTKYGYEALHHICMTTAGLYSQTPGENHIVAQFKETVKKALDNNWAGGATRELGDMVLHIQKRIRTQFAHLYRIDEIEELSIKYAECKFQSLKGKKATVIGTGELGKAAVNKLSNVCDITWIYRNYIPEEKPDNVQMKPLSEMEHILSESDLAVFAISSSEAIVTDRFLESNVLNGKPLFIDLGMPRNIAIREEDNNQKVHIVNLEHLKQWYWQEGADLTELNISAEQKIHDHKERYDEFISSIKHRNP